MVRKTYGDIKDALAQITGETGMPVTDTRVKDTLNLVQQELINEGDFPGVVDRWFVVATDGNLVLPPGLDRLMQITISGVPREIRSPWYQFVQYGPGPQDDERVRNRYWCGPDVIEEVGEVPSLHPIPFGDGTGCISNGTGANGTPSLPGPWKLRVYATVDEQVDSVDPYATVQGLDENGLIVRTQIAGGEWINGERLTITSGSSFVESQEDFIQLDAFTKPRTNGYVRLTAWNGTVEVELSNYAPDETTPSYHKYFSPWLQRMQSTSACCRVVLARCRRRFRPVIEDTDVVMISNLPALRQMTIAVNKRDSGALDEYAFYKATAVNLLKLEASAYRGKSRVPALTFQRGFSIGSLPSIR